VQRTPSLVVLALALVLALPGRALADDPPFVGWSTLLPGLTLVYDPGSENDCVAGRPHCLAATLREMQRRFDGLAASCDHDAIFALSYLRTTQEYGRTIADPTFFEDTPFVNHEDAVFARYYFDAYDAWHGGRPQDTPPAWRAAFEASDRQQDPALADLFLGINAHVQNDLPFVLAGIGLVKPDGTSRKHDHDRVNEFLNRVTDGLMAEIAQRFDPTVDDGNVPTTVDDLVAFQAIPTWRELAWRNAERLATAPTPAARADVAASIQAYAGSQADLIRQALAYPLGVGRAAREAYCAAHHG
jgi:Family of unknown function (DUF5995)